MEATGARVLISGRYELGPLLRRGGMADVHAGTDERLQRPVAIKLLRQDMAERDDVRQRFEVEARAAARLSHPNAVAVYDTGEHNGTPYIVMERLPGQTLADAIADGPVSPSWLIPLAAGVLSALGAAHAAGIVHRDVKPGNILLTDDGSAKITDFGIAKSGELVSGTTTGAIDLTLTGQLVGTPAYLAPERLAGAPATFLSDIYAMGVVLYEALTGDKPFTGASFIAVAQAVQDGRHRSLASARPDLGPAVVTTVERALDRDPSRRFESAEAMAVALTGAVATEPAVPLPTAGEETTVLTTDGPSTLIAGELPLPLAPPPGRRLPLRVLWAAAAAVFVLLLLVLALSGGSHPKPASTTPSTTTPATTAAPTTLTPTSVPAQTQDTPAPAGHHRKGGRKGH